MEGEVFYHTTELEIQNSVKVTNFLILIQIEQILSFHNNHPNTICYTLEVDKDISISGSDARQGELIAYRYSIEQSIEAQKRLRYMTLR